MRKLLSFGKKKVGFCNIASRNLPTAGVLIDSIRTIYGPRQDIDLLILSAERIPFDYKGVTVTYAPNLPNADYWDKVLRYETACRGVSFKAGIVRHLNSLHRYDALFYLDADTELFARFDEAEAVCRSDFAILPSRRMGRNRALWAGRSTIGRSFRPARSMPAFSRPGRWISRPKVA